MKQINLNVTGKPTDTPSIQTDADEVFEGLFESSSRCLFKIPDTATGGARLRWINQTVRFVLPEAGVTIEGSGIGLPTIVYPPAITGLTSDGEVFRSKATNVRWVAALHSDFRLLKMWLEGTRPDALIDARQAAGSEGARVFGTCDFLFKLDPRAYGDRYYDELPRFSDYLNRRGLYWELTVFTDQQTNSFNGFDRQAHWRRTCESLRGQPNVIIELVNEFFKNGVDPRQFRPIDNGCLQASGSFCDGQDPPGPAWSYVTFHPRRDWKWPFTVAPTINELREYPGQRVPILINEPIGASEAEEPGRRASKPALFEKMAVECALWGAGGVFHSQAGLDSEPWGPVQTACAVSFFRGLRR